jgi:hypothetical protein
MYNITLGFLVKSFRGKCAGLVCFIRAMSKKREVGLKSFIFET